MPSIPKEVVVHPLVLLSVVDHYHRSAMDTKKRVVGVLLGEENRGVIDVTHSYAVPFEEDERDPSIWFLDHTFHENMHTMFRKVNAKEKIVGVYSSGPKIRPADLDICELFRRYCPSPILVVIDVKPKELGLPSAAYCVVEEVQHMEVVSRSFQHVPSSIGALEAEEIGVEHLLRDIKDATHSSLSTSVGEKLAALKGLQSRLKQIEEYLQKVVDGSMPLNSQITYTLQDIFNLLPNLNAEELLTSFAVKSNDMMVAMYLSSLIRSIIALHNLINNKVSNKEAEKKEEGKEGQKDKEDTETEAKEKEDKKTDQPTKTEEKK